MSQEEIVRRNLELLVPEGGALRDRAEVLAGSAADLVGDTVREVQLSFELEQRARAAGALEDLLAHHLRAWLGDGSFLSVPRPRSGLQAAWHTLIDLRSDDRDLPGVPAPGEPVEEVVLRLVAALEDLDHDPAQLELWRARLEHARGGARAGEEAYREQLARTPSSGPGSRAFAELALGVAEALVDQGALRAAADLLAELPDPGGGAAGRSIAELGELLALLLGEREPTVEDSAPLRELPASLRVLGEDWPPAASWLKAAEPLPAGQAPWSPLGPEELVLERRALGAAVLAVFTHGRGEAPRAVHLDVAPGLRGRVDAWLVDGEDACCDPRRPEHALVLEARRQRVHGTPPREALSERALALALQPLLDDDGEVFGWVHLEWDHHLVPADAVLGAVAGAWRSRLLVGGGAPSENGAVGSAVLSGDGEESGSPGERRLCAGTFGALVEACGMKLRLRRWWGFLVREGQPEQVAEGGEGLPGRDESPGGGRALERCLATGGVVRQDDPDARLTLHAASASCIVLPLLEAERVQGLLVVESERRRDFRPADVELHAELARRFSPALTLARFRAWHLERYGHDLHLDSSRPSSWGRLERLAAAARSSAPVVLCGPEGAGKAVLARWLHWCRGRGEQSLEVLGGEAALEDCGGREAFASRIRRDRGGLLIDSPEQLDPGLQEVLMQFLEGELQGSSAEARARVVLTTRRPLAESVAAGELRPDLAARLDRLQLHVPGLRDRREELPALVEFLAARLSAEEGLRAPRLEDEAIALLWRQDWSGNLRELEALVFKVVLLHPGETVDAEAVHAVAREFHLQLRERLPSRRPRREDLEQALRTTRKGTGRPNKRRAALYLGWDPDTLVLRMEDAGLVGPALDEVLGAT